METRIIHTKVWRDSWYVGLSRQGKLLWLYLLTNEYINIIGIFELDDRVITFNTGLSQAELEKAKKEIFPKAIFFKGFVRIPNVDKYNSYSGEKNNKARFTQESKIPEEVIGYLRGIDTSMDTSIYTTHNHKSEIINQKSKREGVGERESFSSMSWLESQEAITFLRNKYPTVDVENQLEIAVNWLKSEGKRKDNYKAFMENWCRRCIDKGTGLREVPLEKTGLTVAEKVALAEKLILEKK